MRHRQQKIPWLCVGLERIVMLRYGITDMRALYEGDVRFLSQFRED